MTTQVRIKSKEIDFKSLIIGFLLATVMFLSLGAYGGSGTQDVRIVDINTYDSLKVKLESSNTLKVKIQEVNSSIEVPVKIEAVDSYIKVPVTIKDQPVRVQRR